MICGIGTDVGKTVASAIITESLQADYWKPIQAGDLHFSDSDRVKALISNSKTVIHPNAYALQTPASPHWAAELDQITICIDDIVEPTTANHLVIEGAGGVYVPLNNQETIMDLIKPDYTVVLVSRHYLGSINHTLLTIEALLNKGKKIGGIVFSGAENKATESIILQKTKIQFLGRIDEEPYFDARVISQYAELFNEALQTI